jgi:hypothetical protein
MKRAGMVLVVVGILFVLGVWIWSCQAALEHSERAPMDGQLGEAITCFGGSLLGLIPFLVGLGLLGAGLLSERRK